MDECAAGTRDRFDLAKRYVRPDGEVVWAELSFAAVRGPRRASSSTGSACR